MSDSSSLSQRQRPDKIMVNRPSVTDDDRAAADEVLRSGWIGTGPQCEAFEVELADYLDVSHVVCTSSCTTAIELVLRHLGVGPESRVVVPAWTYPGTALPAVHLGAQILLADVDPDDLNIANDSLERALDQGADLVVPVHMAGNPVDPSVWEICAASGVPILEDAAHAFGARNATGRLRGVGSVAAAFSFHATKNLTCVEGGAIATDDPVLAAALQASRSHGLVTDAWDRERSGLWSHGDLVEPGIKANLPDVLAAIGRSQLRSFDQRQTHRRSLVERYRSHLLFDDRIRPIPADPRPGGADHMMIVEVPEGRRDDIVAHLAAAGVSTGLHYTPLHRLTWFSENARIAPGGLPNAERLERTVLTLPLHAELTLVDVDEVCALLQAALDAPASQD